MSPFSVSLSVWFLGTIKCWRWGLRCSWIQSQRDTHINCDHQASRSLPNLHLWTWKESSTSLCVVDWIIWNLPGFHSRAGMGFLERAEQQRFPAARSTWRPSEASMPLCCFSKKAAMENNTRKLPYSTKILFIETDLAHRCANPCSVVISVTHMARGLVVLPSSEIEQHGNYFTLKYLHLYKLTYRLYVPQMPSGEKKKFKLLFHKIIICVCDWRSECLRVGKWSWSHTGLWATAGRRFLAVLTIPNFTIWKILPLN